MRKLMENRIGRIFVIVLFSLMGLSMLSFGVTDFSMVGNSNAALVGDYKITAAELDQTFNFDLAEEQRNTGQFVNRVQALTEGRLEETLARLILRRQMQQAATDSEVLITEEALATIIRNNDGFQDEEGNFDRERFNFIVYQAGLTPEAYAQQVKANMTRGQMSQAVISGVQAPNLMLDVLTEFQGRTRDVSYVTLGEADVPVEGEPTEEELNVLYEQNLDAFRTPERRTVSILNFGPADVADRVTVTDEQLQAEYNRQIDSFRVDERRRFEQALLDSAEQAELLLAAATEGSSLSDIVAAAFPENAPFVSDVDWAERETLLPEMADVIFEMQVGEISEPIETDLGLHIVRLTGSQEAGTRPLDDVREALTEQVQRRNAADALFDFSAEVDQALIDEQPFEEIAETLKINLITLDGLAEDATLPVGTATPAFGLSIVAEEAFYLEPGEVSPLFESSNGGYLAVRLDSVTPANTQPKEEVQTQLTGLWELIERRRVAADLAAKLDEAARDGAEWNDALTELGLDPEQVTVQQVQQLSRADRNTAIAPAILRGIFDLTEPGDTDRLRIGDRWVVIRIEGVASEAVDPVQIQEMRVDLAETLSLDLLSQYQRVLDQRYPARINYNVLNSFHTPESGGSIPAHGGY
ncbi:MAG: peptidyl-prolyl cis-trans isomerase [Alphaproteobacteria bacterium]|nr:peptidyl-prolyl cis-trans isomerase [Alphaproteobacteria bacterium SS10]MBV6634271.1 peptidyl-prolyl cis-trans isomerase [Alphaproteobacteria bacterium SS10]